MRKTLGLLLLLVGMFALLLVLRLDQFGSNYNQANLWRHISLLAIFAIGEGFVIITGGIDLSVGSLIGFTGMLCASLMVFLDIPPILAIPAVLTFSTLVGLAHGQLITRLKIPPFLVTLSSMMFFQGMSMLINNNGRIPLGPDFPGFRSLGRGGLALGELRIPVPFLILLGVVGIAYFLLNRTVLGQYLLAVGSNEEAARYSGIHTDRVKRFAYMASSFLAGVAGILYAGYLPSPGPTVGQTYELYAIAAAVLGGCSLTGGEGSVIGIVIGAAIMQTLINGTNLLGISSNHEKWIIGAVILIAAILDMTIKRVRRPET